MKIVRLLTIDSRLGGKFQYNYALDAKQVCLALNLHLTTNIYKTQTRLAPSQRCPSTSADTSAKPHRFMVTPRPATQRGFFLA